MATMISIVPPSPSAAGGGDNKDSAVAAAAVSASVDAPPASPSAVSPWPMAAAAQEPPRPSSVPVVPKWVVGLALTQVALSAGVVYGWPSLLRALLRNHQFEELCAAGDTLPCNSQTLALNLVFVAGSFCAQGARIVPGAIMDRYGLAWGALFSHTLIAIGALLFAASDSVTFDAYLPAYLIMGFGGGGVQLTMVTVAAYFPRYQTHLTNTVQGCFNLGAFVFLLFDVWNEGNGGAVSLGAMFYGYACVQAVFAVVVFAIWRHRPRPTRPNAVQHHANAVADAAAAAASNKPTNRPSSAGVELTAVSGGAASSTAAAAAGATVVPIPAQQQQPFQRNATKPPRAPPVFSQSGAPPPYWRAVFTRRYLLLLLMFSGYTLANQFYHGTVASQLSRRLGGGKEANDQAQTYATQFNLIYALIGFLCPVIGMGIHRFGFLRSFWFIGCCHIAYWVITLLPDSVPVQVQYAAFPLYGLGRATKYGGYFSVLGSPAQFGHTGPLFGRLSGLGLLVSAIVSVLQYLLLWIVSNPAGGSFWGVNLVMCLLALPLLPLNVLHTRPLADEWRDWEEETGGFGVNGQQKHINSVSVSAAPDAAPSSASVTPATGAPSSSAAAVAPEPLSGEAVAIEPSPPSPSADATMSVGANGN